MDLLPLVLAASEMGDLDLGLPEYRDQYEEDEDDEGDDDDDD